MKNTGRNDTGRPETRCGTQQLRQRIELRAESGTNEERSAGLKLDHQRLIVKEHPAAHLAGQKSIHRSQGRHERGLAVDALTMRVRNAGHGEDVLRFACARGKKESRENKRFEDSHGSGGWAQS